MYRKKSLVIAIMVIAVLMLAVGYAAFQTQLKINGTGSITGTWEVLITNVASSATGSATNISSPSFTSTSATFNVGLKKPGDKMTFTVTVKNNGSVGAIIDSIDAWESGSPAIKYTISGIQQKSRLGAGASKSFTIVVEFDSTATSIPSMTEKELTITMNCIQDDGQSLTPSDPIIVDSLTAGSEVLFNPVTYAVCSSEDVSNNCYKWYVLKNENTNVDLILNRNVEIGTQNNVTGWNESGAHNNGPTTILGHLNSLGPTGKKWSTALMRSDTYQNTSSSVPLANYTVNYSSLVARIPTYDELNQFKTGNSLPSWLTTNLSGGYWLASSKVGTQAQYADVVFMGGSFTSFRITETATPIGIRPVITIPRSKI